MIPCGGNTGAEATFLRSKTWKCCSGNVTITMSLAHQRANLSHAREQTFAAMIKLTRNQTGCVEIIAQTPSRWSGTTPRGGRVCGRIRRARCRRVQRQTRSRTRCRPSDSRLICCLSLLLAREGRCCFMIRRCPRACVFGGSARPLRILYARLGYVNRGQGERSPPPPRPAGNKSA